MKISPLEDLFFIHSLLILILGFKLSNSLAHLSFSWKCEGHLCTSIVETRAKLTPAAVSVLVEARKSPCAANFP